MWLMLLVGAERPGEGLFSEARRGEGMAGRWRRQECAFGCGWGRERIGRAPKPGKSGFWDFDLSPS